ncbi:MAG TPA: hypothetical protein VJB15_06560 [Rhodothermia bacterium]|nr:hypothetical protein [Rhodothermia bacterium]
MHLAILANELHSFNRTIAAGLARMALACGVTADVYPEGLRVLDGPVSLDFATARSAVGSGIHLMRNRRMLDRLVDQVAGSSVIVVVAHVPISFARGALRNIELLRERLPEIPIVNYAHYYLPTMDKWGAAVLRGVNNGLTEEDLHNLRRGSFHMSRYDWYLVASVTSEIPLPPGPQPYSIVGVDIDDGSLFPEQNGELRGLIDFAQNRMNYPSFRKTQIAALERAGIPYRILKGQFSRSEIREIYRHTGAFFLAHRESFGLPICELQACGSRIFTPRPEWAGAHWIKEDLTVPGPGYLSPNFCVYDDDLGKLTEQLAELKSSFDPARNVRVFEEFHPRFLRGDPEALAGFLNRVEDGTINSRSHLEYENVGV